MPSAKPKRPPTFDAKSFAKRLYERVRQGNGYVEVPAGGNAVKAPVLNDSAPYAAFDYENDEGQPIGFPNFIAWVRGVRDTVNANAVYLDDVKNDLDAHKEADNARHAVIRQDIAELQAAVQSPPFPG